LSLVLFLGAFAVQAVRAQDAASARPVFDVDGNKVFSKDELLDTTNKCLDQWLETAYTTEKLDYCLHKLTAYMRSKGYLQARLDKTLYNQTDSGTKALIPVVEGPLFRVGNIDVKNAKVFTAAQIVETIGLSPGDIADGEKLSAAMFERVKEMYGNLGYIQYTAEITPAFHVKEGADEGVVDIAIAIEEGQQFKVRSIKFSGADKTTLEQLQKELMLHDGEVYNSDLFRQSIARVNDTGLYDPIDVNKDVDFKTNDEQAVLSLTIRLRKRVVSF
jgi:outer membrane protein insertion porin family